MAGKRFPEDFDRIDKIKTTDKMLINDSKDGVDKYVTASQFYALLQEQFKTGIEETIEGFSEEVLGSVPVAKGEGESSTVVKNSWGPNKAGKNAFAEGYSTEATGEQSHSEGYETTASGKDSHAEGHCTSATNHSAHSEGTDTVASGWASHAEGMNTKATNHNGEHAEGKYNKSNTGTIHSVGIGTSDSSRKNAHEITEDGKHYILGVGGYDGTNPDKATDVASQLTELSEEVVYSDPLDGVVFGNTVDDKILKDIFKSVWIEVLDDSIILDTELKFAAVRNDDSRNPSVVFQFSKDSNIVFTYSANEKLSATTHKISCVGHGDYYDKANLHIALDFSNRTENIAFGSASTDSYIMLNHISTQEITSPITIKDKITMIENQIKEEQDNMASLSEYSNALKGCEFGGLYGDNIFKKCIKSIWLQKIDNSLELPPILKFSYFRNNTTNGFMLQIVDESGKTIMEEYSAANKYVGKHIGIATGRGDYEYRVSLHYELDLDDAEIRLNPGDLNTYLVTSELNTYHTSTLTTKEALSEMSGFKGKTIVCFGDSITAQLGEDGLRYTDYLKEFTSANIINVGVGGTQYRQRVAPVVSPSSTAEGWAGLDIINMVKAAANLQFDAANSYRNVVANAADYVDSKNLGRPKSATNTLLSIDWQDVDAVIFFAGHNDWRNGGTERGEHGSNDVNTTIGAINEIIRIMLTTYPHLKLYWCTPIVQWGETSANWTEDKWSDNISYNGYTLKELSELIKKEVVFNHIPICDLYNTLGWNKYNFSQYFVPSDGTHPRKGYKMIAQKIASFLIANRTF